MSKTLQTRIQNKHDIEANWNLATNFIPLAGEVIVYDDLKKIKIGDGTKTVNELDWATLSPQEIEEIFNTKMDKENPTGTGSFSLNRKANTNIGTYSVAEGYNTEASGASSHAEGCETKASGVHSHAEGQHTVASSFASHAEGYYTRARGNYSHAEGDCTTASGQDSHAEGFFTTASSNYQHVQGKYNIEDSDSKYAHIVGNGTSNDACSNAHTLDWDGNGWFAGDVYIGSTSGTDKDDGSKKLATEKYVDETIAENLTSNIYVQADEPENPEEGDFWVDTDDDTQDVTLADVAISGNYNDLINLPDLTKKANLNSPTFIGTPKAPTASKGTNTAQIATTQFVQTALEGIVARTVSYDNSITGINATNVQDALDIMYDKLLPDLIITTVPGSALTLTDGVHTLTGVADGEGKATFSIPSLERWTVTSTLEEQISTEIIDILELTEEYHLTMEYFSASLTITTTNGGPGALVTATCDGCTYEGVLDSTGSCTLTVRRQGTYTVRGEYEGAYSGTRQLYIGTDSDVNPNYTTSITFIVLTVVGDPNILLTVSDGTTTLTRTSTGQDIFLLPNAGTWNVYGTLQGNTVGESITITGYGSYSKDLYYVNTTFGGTSWAVIQAVTKAGRAQSYWAVGDTKTFKLAKNNIAGGSTSYTWYATIMGFNHNTTYEGTNTIHLRFTPRNQWSAYCVGYVPQEDASYANGTLYMNSTSTNEGGWNDSYMRNTICATFYSTNIPADLRAVLGPCTKYTDNAGLAKNTKDAVTATTDYIFLPSEFEIWGSRSYANVYEQNKQTQYTFFKNGNAIALNNVGADLTNASTVPNTTNNSTSISGNYCAFAITWSRSPHGTSATSFCDSEIRPYNNSRSYSECIYSQAYARSSATLCARPTTYYSSYDYYMATGIAPYGVIK